MLSCCVLLLCFVFMVIALGWVLDFGFDWLVTVVGFSLECLVAGSAFGCLIICLIGSWFAIGFFLFIWVS